MFLFRSAVATAAGPDAATRFDHTHGLFTLVLESVVSEEGLVDYRKLAADPKSLGLYLRDLDRLEPAAFARMKDEQKLALLINLYNATAMMKVAERYPIRSFAKRGGLFTDPYDAASVHLAGQTYSLREIEATTLRIFGDGRVVLALVPPRRSSPPLPRQAYRADRLKEMLDEQSTRFVRDLARNRFEPRTVRLWLSSVFGTHEGSFSFPYGGLKPFVARFADKAVAPRLLERRVEVRFDPVDERLNDTRWENDRGFVND